MSKEIEKQIHEIKENLENEEFLANASDEELMGYIFLSEKLNRKIEKIEELSHKEENT